MSQLLVCLLRAVVFYWILSGHLWRKKQKQKQQEKGITCECDTPVLNVMNLYFFVPVVEKNLSALEHVLLL